MTRLLLELSGKTERAEAAIVGSEPGIERAGAASDRGDGSGLITIVPRDAEAAACRAC